MRKRLSLVAACALATGAIAAGCGNDGGSDPLSKSEYIKQGDEICKQGTQELNQQAKHEFGNQQASKSQVETFAVDVVANNLQGQIDDLRNLSAPEGDQDQVNAIYDAADEGIAQIEDDPSIISGGGTPPGFKQANQLASAYGFKECGG